MRMRIWRRVGCSWEGGIEGGGREGEGGRRWEGGKEGRRGVRV